MPQSDPRVVSSGRPLPRITYPPALPITAQRDKIVEAIRGRQVVIITGDTGSGKSTQIPKMCLEAGRGRRGLVGCTQPRRIAAVTVAQRIAEELRQEVGGTVGYRIRFEERLDQRTRIKIMTDGILLMEAQGDPTLRAYDTILVDEAHERTVNIDFVLGILKLLCRRRRDLKVIVTSATIDTEKFSRYFDDAPVIEVSGRMYPVEVRYCPVDRSLEEAGEITYVDAAVQAVDALQAARERGDCLIFMPREQDIREACDLLAGRDYRDTVILPLYGRLSGPEQHRVFQGMPRSQQKIVVATNVAETSVTIPGIRYVIDTGLARLLQYNPRSRTTGLPVKKISRSSADQRMGRCGRVGEGICIRLYEEADYQGRPLFTPPEIQRASLADVILRMISLKLGDIASFPFIDPPPPKGVRDGIELLRELGAVEAKGEGGGLTLTDTGRMMARMPVDPQISRMILEADREGCLEEVTVIASALCVQDPRERPPEKEVQADQMHALFKDPKSDFVTLLNIWSRYHRNLDSLKTQGQMRKFCRSHFLSYRRIREWRDVYEQITAILAGQPGRPRRRTPEPLQDLYGAIHRSILCGYLSNIAVKKEKNLYTGAKGKEVMLFPASGLFNRGGNWIVAAELVETSRLFARTAAEIDSGWLEALGGTLCRATYFEPFWSKTRGEVLVCQQISLFGLVIVPRRPVPYGPVAPEEASALFVRQALVAGEVRNPLPFLLANQRLIEEAVQMEDKMRRHDLLIGEEEIVRFYEERLPGIFDVKGLLKLIRDRGGDDFLRMGREDILRHDPDLGELALYPDEITLGRVKLRCRYRFDPSRPDDGLNVSLPMRLVTTIPPPATDWLVPGLRREKIEALVRGLPKEYRKKLQPIAQTCAVLLSELEPGDEPLVTALGRFIEARFGLHIPAAAWPDRLDEHLQMRLVVVDPQGREVAASRNIHALQGLLGGDAQDAATEKARRRWEKRGLTDWDFGDLPEEVLLEDGTFLYPALEAEEDSVRLRLFGNRREADGAHPEGVLALFRLRFREDLRHLRKSLILPADMKARAEGFGGVRALEGLLYAKVCRDLFACPLRTREAFAGHGQAVRPRILPRGQEVLALARPVVQAYHEVFLTVAGLEKANRSNRPALHYLQALKGDLGRLVPGDFLERYEEERLPHLIRYLRALYVRADRGLTHLEKAFAKTEEVRVLTDQRVALDRDLPSHASPEKRRALEAYRWMIEEYKVSLFAQELKTAFPVSRKRLEEKLWEIERMA